MADASSTPSSHGRRIVLCFDGTGNSFQAGPTDTNIVKLYELMDRSANDQFHYYQPGIGTYTNNQSEGVLIFSKLWLATKSTVAKALDQGLGLTFRDHVLAGYQFLMAHYETGDDIYVFGFSRGLLSRGNNEMVPFAWTTFSDWLRTSGDGDAQDTAKRAYMDRFRSTFCRNHVKVKFLGIFDCVNSVGTFEAPFWKTSYKHMPQPPAEHIRHAVSIHERRLKFKPALFEADLLEKSDNVKEVWFCGNHSDVGGGWGYEKDQVQLLSDEPLQWMIDEVLSIDSENPLKFRKTVYQPEKPKFEAREPPPVLNDAWSWFSWWKKPKDSTTIQRQSAMRPHDPLAFGGGGGWFSVCAWWILEILPFFSRLELENTIWTPRYWPPNLGAERDLPDSAVLHSSVYRMYHARVLKALPKLGGDGPPRLSKLSQSLFKFEDMNEELTE